jgi:hypothetical protein
MTLSLLVVSALLGVPNLDKNTALACTCAEQKEPTEALKESTAVFVGRVVEIEENQANQFSFGAIFEIHRAWKGIESDMPVVRVTTGISGDTCGYGFQENKEYLVYAYGDPKELATSICSRTMTADNSQPDLTALGPSAVSFDQDSEEEKYTLSIWPIQSEISENWQTDIRTRICPSPEAKLIVNPEAAELPKESLTPLNSELSIVNVTHFATNSDGVATPIWTEYFGGSNDFCEGNVGFGHEPLGPGDWTIRANATWTAPDGTIHQIQGNEARLLVKPALYKTNSEVLFEYDTDYYKSLRLLDWNPDGGAILLAYHAGYQKNMTSEIKTNGGYETQVSLGVLDPNETTINRVALPMNFTYIFDARHSPSDSNIIFITGSIGDLVLQSGLFIYSFEHGTLSRVGPYTDDLAWIRDVTGDGQDDFVVGITNRTSEDGEITANTVEVWIADSNANPIEKLYGDTLDPKRGLQIHDVTKDGKKILMTSSLYLGGPVTVYNLTIFDIENKRFESTLPLGSGDGARFNPAGDLVVYPVGLGHRTPGGPLIVTTLDGSYVERLSSGERAGTYDSPASFVISPDGTTIIAGVAQWGYGNIYVTKNELVHPMPEFGPQYSVVLAASMLVTFVFLWRYRQCQTRPLN